VCGCRADYRYSGSPRVAVFVVGPDPRAEGHYVVRLDRPARYDDGVNPPQTLREVVEAADNLEVLAG
jgi:hypothetical protein